MRARITRMTMPLLWVTWLSQQPYIETLKLRLWCMVGTYSCKERTVQMRFIPYQFPENSKIKIMFKQLRTIV